MFSGSQCSWCKLIINDFIKKNNKFNDEIDKNQKFVVGKAEILDGLSIEQHSSTDIFLWEREPFLRISNWIRWKERIEYSDHY